MRHGPFAPAQLQRSRVLRGDNNETVRDVFTHGSNVKLTWRVEARLALNECSTKMSLENQMENGMIGLDGIIDSNIRSVPADDRAGFFDQNAFFHHASKSAQLDVRRRATTTDDLRTNANYSSLNL